MAGVPEVPFVSRGGIKLDAALSHFAVEVVGRVCADLGCSTGGFTDCLLKRGAARVYAVDTGYGVLDYRLRRDPRVVVMERTNAMHVTLPERADVVVIDAGWTRQRHILPAADRLLRGPDGVPAVSDGWVVSLIKPHYEADRSTLRRGILPDEAHASVIAQVRADIESAGFRVVDWIESPITGQKGNREFLALLRPYPPVG